MYSFFICLLLFFVITNTAFAQSISNSSGNSKNSASSVEGVATLGIGHLVETKDKNVKDGSILSASDHGAVLSSLAYDPQVMGVVSRDAAILLNTSDSNNTVPVIATGTVYIFVSTKEGAIKKGDLLATSSIPGVAVKAVKSGYVLGTAMEDYSNSDPKKVDKIVADLDLHYFNNKPTFPGTLSDIFKIAFLPTKEAPSPIFKYIVAAGVVIASFILGFLTFGRTAAKGIEALGRNPAASKIIHLGIIFNVVIVVVIVVAGLTVSFFILRL